MIPLLQRLWRYWQRFGLLLGNIVGRVLLSVLYFTVFAPFAIAVRLQDPLKLKRPPASSFWSEHQPSSRTLEEARRLT